MSYTKSWTVVDADVLLLYKDYTRKSATPRHLMLRKAVYEGQQRRNKRCMIVDSSLFLYADITQSFNYLRYGYDGIFPTQQNIVGTIQSHVGKK